MDENSNWNSGSYLLLQGVKELGRCILKEQRQKPLTMVPLKYLQEAKSVV